MADCHRHARKRGMAPPLSSLLLRIETRKSSETAVVYLVRSIGLMPESVSHDWHVQPSCQRPNRGPPERREFSPGETARVRIRLSSKLYNHTVRRKPRQPMHPTRFPDVFHIGNSAYGMRAGELDRTKKQVPHRLSARFGMTRLLGSSARKLRATVCAFRFGLNHLQVRRISAQAEAKDRKLRKDPMLEVLAFKVPFGNACFPNEVPWPGRLRASCPL